MHAEKLYVKSLNKNQLKQYEFTTCGAFTAYHVNSSLTNDYFDPTNEAFKNDILVILIIYTCKILIELTDDLRNCVRLSYSNDNIAQVNKLLHSTNYTLFIYP